MNKIAILLSGMLLITSIPGYASDVAEAAKKEKARREAIRKEGKPSKTFTNQDVADLKSTLAFESSTPAEETAEQTPSTEITTIPAVDPNLGEPVAQEQPQENNEEAERLREEREALEQQARDAQETINQGGGYHTRNIGSQYKAKREAEARIRQIDDELANQEKKEEEQ